MSTVLPWRRGLCCVPCCVLCCILCCILFWGVAANAAAQTATALNAIAQTTRTGGPALTWPELRDKFLATNPSLQAGQIGIEASKATEITAYLRPNPTLSTTLDQVGHTVGANFNAFSAATLTTTLGYLHERANKRELRRDSAQGATTIAVSGQADLVRNLVFTLRSAFVQVLQAKALLALARDNLTNYDQVISIGRDRFKTGDI